MQQLLSTCFGENEMASVDEIVKALNEALQGTGIIIVTPDYVYAVYEKEENKWLQVSYDFLEKEGFIEELNTRKALLYLIEEVSKSLIRFEKGAWYVVISEAELSDVIEKIKG